MGRSVGGQLQLQKIIVYPDSEAVCQIQKYFIVLSFWWLESPTLIALASVSGGSKIFQICLTVLHMLREST